MNSDPIYTPELETDRLLLRPLSVTDAPAIQRQFSRWEVVRLMSASIPWSYPEDGALRFLRDMALPAMAAGREWHWSLRLKTEPDVLIGVISLMTTPDDNRGFWLATEQQGQGLMAEACAATAEFWFETLGQPVMRVLKAAANEASRRVSQREGMTRVWTGERAYVSGMGPAELWQLTADQWRARTGRTD